MIEARRRQDAEQKAARAARAREPGGVPDYEEDGYPDPDPRDLREIPWGDEGPDPLEELWESS